MPLYEYKCLDCGEVFEALQSNYKQNPDLACKNCGSSHLKKLVSSFSAGLNSSSESESCPTGTCNLTYKKQNSTSNQTHLFISFSTFSCNSPALTGFPLKLLPIKLSPISSMYPLFNFYPENFSIFLIKRIYNRCIFSRDYTNFSLSDYLCYRFSYYCIWNLSGQSCPQTCPEN